MGRWEVWVHASPETGPEGFSCVGLFAGFFGLRPLT